MEQTCTVGSGLSQENIFLASVTMSKAKNISGSEDIAKLRSELSKKALSIITEVLPNKCESLTKMIDVRSTNLVV